MSLNLINSFGLSGVNYGIYTEPADVLDTDYLSRYFVVSDFNPTFSAGKNSLCINGSSFLANGSEILIECIDSGGNRLYIELAKYSNSNAQGNTYTESGGTKVYSIYVFGDTQDGIGKLVLYGMLTDGRTVKWIQNIVINKALKNSSTVRFYQSPTIEIESEVVPVLSSTLSSGTISNKTLNGKVQGLAVNPQKSTILTSVNRVNTDVDYRLTLTSPIVTDVTMDSDEFNSQMIGSIVTLNVNTIQSPNSQQYVSVSQTASFVIKNVLNSSTIQIDSPYYYQDGNGNSSITNIVDANISISYPFINYNDAISSYQTSNIGGTLYTVKQSYADITYRNIRTFSGYVARHKIYRKSMLSNSDFSIVADEPIYPNEILMDDLTQNKYYDLLGKFYNDQHISRYWLSSSTNLSLSHTPSFAVDSMLISSPNPASLTGSDYVIVKNDSIPSGRNANYIPYDPIVVASQSGSSYDSNFMELKANTQYIIETSTFINKSKDETNANVTLYFTSSIPEASSEENYTDKFGIKIIEISANKTGSSADFINSYAFFTPKSDLYGTIVIVPTKCNVHIKNISFRTYGDDGFSPDEFTTRIPWPVNTANECFQIKAELFNVDGGLIYSNLNIIQSFDPSGSTLIPFVPGGGDYQDLVVSGSLYVSKSIVTEFGDVYIPNIVARPGVPDVSQSRFVSVRADGALVFDPLVDVSSDDKYIYVSTGDGTNRVMSGINTSKTLTSRYDSAGGRKIYWIGGVKYIETNP